MRIRLVIAALIASACSEHEIAVACEEVGLCAHAPLASEQYIVVIDGTPGSTANAASVEAVLARVLARAVDRPGSRVRIWTVGTNAVDSREVASAVVPSPPRRIRNPRAYRSETTARLRRSLIPPITVALQLAASQRRSAVAETLTLAVRSFDSGGRRWLILVSDLREKTGSHGLDLECPRRLPTTRMTRTYLDRRGLLAAASMAGIDVVVVDLGLPPFPMRPFCDLSVRRGDELFDMWRDLLHAAGARRVVRGHGTADFGDAGHDVEQLGEGDEDDEHRADVAHPPRRPTGRIGRHRGRP